MWSWHSFKNASLLRFLKTHVRLRLDYFVFLGGLVGKESAHNAGDLVLIPGSGRCSREGNGNPLQYSCLGNPMDRGAWQVNVHGIAESWTQLSN